MSDKHPHLEVITAYYSGEDVELRADDRAPWVTMPAWVSGRFIQFNTDWQYRIKPKLHTVELTQDEVEALISVLRFVGGHPDTTARKHIDSAHQTLKNKLDSKRLERIEEWTDEGGITTTDTGIHFTGPLPKGAA